MVVELARQRADLWPPCFQLTARYLTNALLLPNMTLQSVLLFGGLWVLFVVAYAAALIAYRVTNWDVWVAAAIIAGGVGIAGALATLP